MPEYQVTFDSPLGERRGTLRWTEDGGRVTGTLTLLGFDNPVRGTRDGAVLTLTHELRTAVSTLPCRTRAELRGEELSGAAASAYGRIQLYGRLITPPRKEDTPLGADAES